ncbi:Cation/H+ exchanger [Thamnidium elegans]|nr:Cation/H+ exchanger [Thamnidium elegans]
MDIDTTVSKVASVLGGFILLYGVCSLVIKEKLYISEASVAILCGILCGPLGFDIINIDDWEYKQDLTRQFTRIVIAIQVMAAGVSLPKAYLSKELKSLLVLLGPVMIFMWIVSGLGVWYFIPRLSFLESLMIASCFTPTDPVLANSIVQGYFAEQHVPRNIRNLIMAESGANDGLGYPFLFLAIYLIKMNTVGEAIFKWSWWIMGYQIGFSIVIGFVVGYIARKILRFSEERKWIDKESFLVYAIALALFLMGTVGLVGSDDLLACFIAGNSFTWDDWFKTETENSHLAEPWSAFNNTETQLTFGKLLGLAVFVLLFRRLPVIIGLYKYIPAIPNWRQAVFMGWFGPMGVGALFYYTIAVQYFEFDGPNAHARQVIEPIIYFIILSSVVIHGITIPVFFLGSFASRTLSKLPSASSDNSNQVSFFTIGL